MRNLQRKRIWDGDKATDTNRRSADDREIMATKDQLNALLKPAKVRNVLPKKHHILIFTHAYGLNHPFLRWYKEKVLPIITPADPSVAESLRVL